MMRSPFLVLLAILAGTAVLIGLGTWQVQRLHWKEALISRIDSRRAQSPRRLADLEERWHESGDVDYFPVRVSGRFDHEAEQYFYTTLDGSVGWNVYAPLFLDDGRAVLVNRGFVPDGLRDPARRQAGNPTGTVSLTGLARNPIAAKPNRFVPNNEPAENTFFWKDRDAMGRAADVENDLLVPFFIDAGYDAKRISWPRGGVTLVELPNNHLQYAITWFGLALALLGVGGYYIVSHMKRDAQ